MFQKKADTTDESKEPSEEKEAPTEIPADKQKLEQVHTIIWYDSHYKIMWLNKQVFLYLH